MIFNSFQFIWLFPIIFVVYWVIVRFRVPTRLKNKVGTISLLFISYGLYLQYSISNTLILFGVTLCTYTFARIIEYRQAYRQKRYLIWFGVLITLFPLIVFKYFDFITDAGASALSWIGIDTAPIGLNWVVPLGLSFYTFQAIGYLCDVYYGKIRAEHNFVDYMLFVAFFPQILCGPISKAEDLLPQIKTYNKFNYGQSILGCRFLLWGMVLKVCVADRFGIYVDTVYADYYQYSSLTCLIASFAYSLQIYSDFAGYSFIAIGVAKLLGYNLILNFNRPYNSISISEFWKKWNISLTKWLTAYIYIPLGGNRKGKVRTYLNILSTFLVSGIWHGANWTFLLWGSIHGLVLCMEKAFGLNKPVKSGLGKIVRIITTFLIVNFAWVYFRMPTIREGSNFIAKMLSFDKFSIYLPEKDNIIGCVIALFILVCYDLKGGNKSPLPQVFFRKSQLRRRSSYVFMMLLILIFGIFDNTSFIYIQF